jgi:hypothetical protein
VHLGFAVNQSLSNFWFLFGFYGLYMGLTEGVEKALISDIAPAGLHATSIGLHATLVGIGLLPASLLPEYSGSFWARLRRFILEGLWAFWPAWSWPVF